MNYCKTGLIALIAMAVVGLSSNEAQAKNKCAEGALVGGIIGGIIGAIDGDGRGKNIRNGIAIGAGAGCVAGVMSKELKRQRDQRRYTAFNGGYSYGSRYAWGYDRGYNDFGGYYEDRSWGHYQGYRECKSVQHTYWNNVGDSASEYYVVCRESNWQPVYSGPRPVALESTPGYIPPPSIGEPTNRKPRYRTKTVTAIAGAICMRKALRRGNVRNNPRSVKNMIFNCNAGRHAQKSRLERKRGFRCDAVPTKIPTVGANSKNLTKRLFNYAGGKQRVKRWCRNRSGVSQKRCMNWFRRAAWDLQYTCTKRVRR